MTRLPGHIGCGLHESPLAGGVASLKAYDGAAAEPTLAAGTVVAVVGTVSRYVGYGSDTTNRVSSAPMTTTEWPAYERAESMTNAEPIPDQGPMHRQFRYDATGLAGKRVRLSAEMRRNDAGDPHDLPTDITDVVAVDDTPSVFFGVWWHPPDDPTRVAIVAFNQPVLYDDE